MTSLLSGNSDVIILWSSDFDVTPLLSGNSNAITLLSGDSDVTSLLSGELCDVITP